MTAYRKFKLPEAAGPPATLANPATVLGHEPKIVACVATVAAGNAQTTNLDGQLKDCAPPDPGEVEVAERKGMAAGGVPESYLDAWTRLQCQKPMWVSDANWRQAIDDAGKFLDAWGSLALELQWTVGELFDVPRDGKTGSLVWFQKGECVRSLGPEHAVLGNGERVFNKLTRGEWINSYAKGKH